MQFIVFSEYSGWLFWLSAATAVVAQLAVVHAALAGRTPGTSDRRITRVRELFWVLIPAATLLAVLVWTWMRLPEGDVTSGSGMGSIGLALLGTFAVGS